MEHSLYCQPLSTFFSLQSDFCRRLEELVGGKSCIDLLFHWPRGIQQRHYFENLIYIPPNTLKKGVLGTVTITLTSNHTTTKKTTRLHGYDHLGHVLSLVYFNGGHRFLPKSNLGEKNNVVVSGKITKNPQTNMIEIVQPDFVGPKAQLNNWVGAKPIYPLTRGVTHPMLLRLIKQLLEKTQDMEEWHESKLLKQYGWPSFHQALITIHEPKNDEDLTITSKARQRLIFDEFVAYHLSLRLIFSPNNPRKGINQRVNTSLRQKFLDNLPFQLTPDQLKAIDEIDQDMGSSRQMVRLLQGDVGCGKTAVAMVAMLNAIGMGNQVALLAPTDILARQHFETLRQYLGQLTGPFSNDLLLDEYGIALLTAREKGKSRQKILKDLENGVIRVIVGTHALIQESVVFSSLSFVVIDEQHRFGVDQRMSLATKGTNPDILLMSATPIPRSLMLAFQGEMDITTILNKPEGRSLIETRIIPNHRLPELLTFLTQAINKGEQAYWVCPMIEENTLDLVAAKQRFKELEKHFDLGFVGLIHGGLKSSCKEKAMEDFKIGITRILVTTTVIEVGVDVPNASIMIIENAQRFGLAQLHQLRGRVGRGTKKSRCFLVYTPPLSYFCHQRLFTMRKFNDGFNIAQKDLFLRGAGNLIGTKQSGIPKFRLCELNKNELNKEDLDTVEEKDCAFLEELFTKAHDLVFTMDKELHGRYSFLLTLFHLSKVDYQKAG